ncbi:hypothetical protein SAMN05660733_06389 [Lentzea albidocapillata]|uniref:Uncharacterized protein n=1 Tax=Lentzea albidocapillata TaxID=40571 RepID=A0A1W2FHL1_9PSEU|nr:hypothetical protein SAMN05660733_06389 [Lentzea albidocapillata]
MTSIAVWAGIDSRRPASVYIASDSRISWGNGERWNQGRKVFSSFTTPHIFSYWGDVLFPALAIPIVLDRIERGLLLAGDEDISIDRVEQAFRSLWSDYPQNLSGDLGIVHAWRIGQYMTCDFKVSILTYQASSNTWQSRSVGMPKESSMLHVAGSGAKFVRDANSLWQSSSASKTSRAVYSAFCEALDVGRDPMTGGAPQIVGLYRKGPGSIIGTVHQGQRYLAGSRLLPHEDPTGVEWRNSLFERIDGTRKKRLSGAQAHEKRP